MRSYVTRNHGWPLVPRRQEQRAVLFLTVVSTIFFLGYHRFSPEPNPHLQSRTLIQKSLPSIQAASWQKLENIPGIGPVTAKRITKYRNHSAIPHYESLLNVTGIGPETLETLKKHTRLPSVSSHSRTRSD